jgi:hypothetical protein
MGDALVWDIDALEDGKYPGKRLSTISPSSV